MGIASVVLGILAILISWIPCLWPIVVGHVLLGTGLGVADVVGKKKTASADGDGDKTGTGPILFGTSVALGWRRLT